MSQCKFWFFDGNRPGYLYLGTEDDADCLQLDGGNLCVLTPTQVKDLNPEPGYCVKWNKREWECQDLAPRYRNANWAD